jgi:hypothetical protein
MTVYGRICAVFFDQGNSVSSTMHGAGRSANGGEIETGDDDDEYPIEKQRK